MKLRLSPFVDRVGERKLLLIIASVSFIGELIGMRAPNVYGEPYLVAKNIVAGKGFVFAYPFTAPEVLTCYITPLYTYLQVPFLWSGIGERGIQVMNLLLLQAGCFVTYRFFRQFTTREVCISSFAALSFYIPFWALSYTLEPNSLNLLLLVLTVSNVYSLAKSPTRKGWLSLGVLFGAQLWVRPDILIGLAMFGAWLLIYATLKRRETLGGLAMAAIIGLLMISPWTARNYSIFHKFILVSANSGFNLFMGNSSASTGEISDQAPTAESIRLTNMISEYSRTHDQVEVDEYCQKLAQDWIVGHPGEAFTLDLKKLQYHWLGRSELGTQYHFAYGALTGIYRAMTLVLLAFGLYGLFVLKDRFARSLILTICIYSSAVSTIFFVQSRHRTLKVDPFLVPLAVIGVASTAQKLGPRSADGTSTSPTLSSTSSAKT